ncbi:hypothetical protein OS493_038923 [Desmophyllum pertusum]|uniref:CAP-Gly domain-containing protein n=1 Tax=Desmophyllum pertusum TaxID=174260 RepID=A0A9X0D6H1_9CNID|nr:hypothetical protein OS493_038923 [Desmophyllum pertusum]
MSHSSDLCSYKNENDFFAELYYADHGKNPGQGTSDGTFRNKRYFNCGADSGVFVGLDKLKPKEDLDPPANLQKDAKMLRDYPFRGTVRYIGEEKDASGNVQTIVGLEMDERVGSGTGKRNGRQVFVCKRDFAGFVALETVIPEKDFDENPKETTGNETSEKQDPIQEQIKKDESFARSMSYDYGTSSGESVRKVRKTSLVDSADAKLIMAAGESSQTDPSAFIEKQRQMFNEMQSSNTPSYRDNDDVDMQDEDRTGNAINFNDDHYKSTSPNSSVRDDGPVHVITKQPGHSQGFNSQDTTKTYADYVNIEEGDYAKLIKGHECGRHAYPGNRCNEEAMHPEQGVGTKPLLAAEVVSDCSPRTSEEVDDEMLPKKPAEQLELQSAVLYSEDSAADKKTDIESSQMTADIPHGLEVGSMVEVPMAEGLPRYGVIRWIGNLPQVKDKLVAGLELEDEQSQHAQKWKHLMEIDTSPALQEEAFGSLPSPDVKGITVPPKES